MDPSVTVGFTLEPGEVAPGLDHDAVDAASNLAFAVGPEIGYAVFESAGERFVLAADAAGRL